MAFDTWGYISSLIGQLNLNNMDSATRARLNDLIKKKVATADQQAWKPDDAPQDMSQFTDHGGQPTAAELEDLYRILQDIFASVESDKDLMADKKVKAFIDRYYGVGKTIEPVVYENVLDTNEKKQQIIDYINANKMLLQTEANIPEKDLDKLLQTLGDATKTYYTDYNQVTTLRNVIGGIYTFNINNNPQKKVPVFLYTAPLTADVASEIAAYINRNLAALETYTSIPMANLQQLATGMRGKTYNTNIQQLNTLKQLMGHMDFSNTPPPPGMPPACFMNGSLFDRNKPLLFLDQIDDFIQHGGAQLDDQAVKDLYYKTSNKTAISNTQATALNNNAQNLFSDILKEGKVSDAIKTRDQKGDLRRSISDGFDKTNYKDGKNVLAPKYQDRKTFWDNAKSNVKGFYNDTLGKLSQKHTRHIYSTNARYIVQELINEGVKPTDGTKKILDTMDSIMGNLPSPVQDQAKKVKEMLGKLSGTKIFAQALHDGDQMRALVQQIIIDGVNQNKIEETKIALEMLAVMRYTMTTSSVRDKLQQADFTIFSDPGLSFNKGPFQYITKAFDKTLQFAMLATFEAVNLAKNVVNEHGVKFGRGEGRLDKRTTDSAEYKDANKKIKMQELFAFWDFVNSSANSKDYNILRKHSNVQKNNADKELTGQIVHNDVSGADISDPTAQQKRYIEWMNKNNIGRAP